MSCKIDEYIIYGVLMAYMMADVFPTVFGQSTNGTNEPTHTHTYTHTRACHDECNRSECNVLHFA